jgi:hypothetical protein
LQKLLDKLNNDDKPYVSVKNNESNWD